MILKTPDESFKCATHVCRNVQGDSLKAQRCQTRQLQSPEMSKETASRPRDVKGDSPRVQMCQRRQPQGLEMSQETASGSRDVKGDSLRV